MRDRRLLVAVLAIVLSGCRGVRHEAVVYPAVGSTPAAAEARPARTSEHLLVIPGTVIWPKLVYPEAKRGDVVDDYHGTKVADPYRWLEDGDSPEARRWIDAENEVTQAYLGGLANRDALKKRLTELWNYERYSLPYREGGRYVISKNDGLQNQNVIYVADKIDAAPRVLIDPNTLSDDGTVALAGTSVSKDGKLIAYGVADAGSDWVTWKVKDIATGKDLADKVEWVKFAGASWTKDNAGFFYSRFDAPKPGEKLTGSNRFHKLHYHRLGTPQSADPLIYERPEDGELNVSGAVSDDGAWLVVTIRKGTQRKNIVGIAELSANPADSKPAVRELIGGFESSYAFVGNRGSTLWFRTDRDAPRGCVIAIDAKHPEKAAWKTVIPQGAETLVAATHVGGRLIATYLEDARSLARVFETDGTFVRDVNLPGLGTAAGFDGDPDDAEAFYSFTSFTDPGTIYRYDVATGESTVFKRPQVKFDPDLYETTQVFYPSKDGTKVPLFLTHRRGLKPDRDTPVLLYAYGGFNISITPSFTVTNLAWMEMGGVYAVANLRGGGEYGEEWHAAGMKHKKQNVFDDFIGAAEWLIGNHQTRREKLAIFGGSNGGLLVGAVMIQRPDLFGACMPAVGVMDMLRFHKFTVGWGWVPEYGTPDDADDFKTLYAYSPYHNLRREKYPATLITTADHDDRVVPAHSFKFAAALQAAQGGDAPVLIRIETRAGHGAGKPTKKQIEEAADRLAFLTKELGLSPRSVVPTRRESTISRMNGRSSAARRAQGSLRDRRRDAAALALMEAAERVIAEKGYEGATMQDIALAAGCAAGTTYLYFPGKEELFHAIVTRHVVAVSGKVQAALRSEGSAVNRLKAGLAALVTYFNDHRDFFRIFYTALPGGRAHVQSNLRGEALDAFKDSRRGQIAVVREAQREGTLRRDLPADELVDFIHGVNIVTFARWAMADRAPSAEQQLKLLWELELGGLRGSP